MKIVSPLYKAAFNETNNFDLDGFGSKSTYGWCVLGGREEDSFRCYGRMFFFNDKKYAVELWSDNYITIEECLDNGKSKILFKFPKPIF